MAMHHSTSNFHATLDASSTAGPHLLRRININIRIRIRIRITEAAEQSRPWTEIESAEIKSQSRRSAHTGVR